MIPCSLPFCEIEPIKAAYAQPLCDAYADKWGTGRIMADPRASWAGWFRHGVLHGVLGYTDDAAFGRRIVLSWHVDSTRYGKLAARDLLLWVYQTLPVKWIIAGTIVPSNEAGRKFLAKLGYTEAAIIIVTPRKEA